MLKYVEKQYNKNVDMRTTRFWNRLQRVRSNAKAWKTK